MSELNISEANTVQMPTVRHLRPRTHRSGAAERPTCCSAAKWITRYRLGKRAGSSGFRGRHAPGNGHNGAGAGLDLGDETGGHGGPDDVVAEVVLAGDAVEGLDVDVWGVRTDGSSSAPQKAHFGMVLTSG